MCAIGALLTLSCSTGVSTEFSEEEQALALFCDHLRAAGFVRHGEPVWLNVANRRVVNFTALRLLNDPTALTLEMIEEDHALDESMNEVQMAHDELILRSIESCQFKLTSHVDTVPLTDPVVTMSTLVPNPHATASEYRDGFFMSIGSRGGGTTDFWVALKSVPPGRFAAAVIPLDTDD